YDTADQIASKARRMRETNPRIAALDQDAKTAIKYGEIRRFHGPGERIECLAFQDKGGLLTSISAGGVIQVSGAEDHKQARPLSEHRPEAGKKIAAAALSIDGSWVALADDKGQIEVRNLERPNQVIQLLGNAGQITSLALFVPSNGDVKLAAGTKAGTV